MLVRAQQEEIGKCLLFCSDYTDNAPVPQDVVSFNADYAWLTADEKLSHQTTQEFHVVQA
jgi:hypothetical protein